MTATSPTSKTVLITMASAIITMGSISREQVWMNPNKLDPPPSLVLYQRLPVAMAMPQTSKGTMWRRHCSHRRGEGQIRSPQIIMTLTHPNPPETGHCRRLSPTRAGLPNFTSRSRPIPIQKKSKNLNPKKSTKRCPIISHPLFLPMLLRSHI